MTKPVAVPTAAPIRTSVAKWLPPITRQTEVAHAIEYDKATTGIFQAL